jgi:hypothetical protein
VFLHLETFLGGQQFHEDSEVKEAINTSQVAGMQEYKNWYPL